MYDNDLLEKLRKIKALADDAQNDHECQTAMLMFQRLLEKNGLDVSQIDMETQTQEAPEEVDIHQGQRIEKWMHYLHCVIAGHFRCVPVTTHRRSGQTLQFIGHKRDTLIAAEAFQTALTAAEHLYSRYKLRRLQENALGGGELPPAQPGGRTNRQRYLLGFGLGLNAAYEKQEAETTLGIILTTPDDVLAAVQGFKTRSFNTQQAKQDENTSVGYADGFNVGRGDRLADAMDA